MRDSKAVIEMVKQTWDIVDNEKPFRSRVMRTAEDVQMFQP